MCSDTTPKTRRARGLPQLMPGRVRAIINAHVRGLPRRGICCALLLVALAASRSDGQGPPAPDSVADAFLQRLVGEWRMVGIVRGRPAEYRLKAERTLAQRYVELHMLDVALPPQYEARVFIGADTVRAGVLGHWLDSFGAAFSVPHGTGVVQGDTMTLTIAYPAGTFRDIIVLGPGPDEWVLRIDAATADGDWRRFAEYRITRTQRAD
jgi:hypothetical protein